MTSILATLPEGSLVPGDLCWLATRPCAGNGLAVLTARSPVELRAGEVLMLGDQRGFQVMGRSWWPEDSGSCVPCHLLRALTSTPRGPGEAMLSVRREGWSLAWVTVSDKGYVGQREDTAGPAVYQALSRTLDLSLAQGYVVPDDERMLQALIVRLALDQQFDLVVTTGGTGVAPRDVTPEATLAVIHKRLPGLERAMTQASLEKTPHGALSRAVCGVVGQSLVMNLPGSPKAVGECLAAVSGALAHGLAKIAGDPSDCAGIQSG